MIPLTEYLRGTMRYLISLCLALLALPVLGAGAVLEYKLSGLEGRMLENASAWLGKLPETSHERLNFLVTAQQRVEDSLQALGYYNADITTAVKRTEPVWSMQITVVPGEPVLIRTASVELLGAARDDSEFARLLATAPFKLGDVFNHGDYENFKNQLLTLGQQRGYFDARLVENRVAVNAVANTADIVLRYESGERFRFGHVTYDDTGLEPALLEALQPFRQGDYFEQAKLQVFQAKLQRTRYFSGVILTPEFDKIKDYQVPLLLKLHPARRHSFDVGFGYSTDTQERVSFTWRTPRLNRFGHSQETRIAYSAVNPSGRFTYTIPLSHPLNDVLHLSALLEDNQFGDIDSRQKQAEARREKRGEKWLYSFSARALEETWELQNTIFDNRYLLPGFALSRSDRKGSVIDPSSGFSQFYKFEGGGSDLGSDINLVRATANFSYIVTPIPQHRVVSRLALGAVLISDEDRANLAPSLSFFAGGSQSIRGYGYQQVGVDVKLARDNGSLQSRVIGGDRLITGSVEYQYYFNDTWRGALFVDAGDAFDSGSFDVRVGPGFGVHYLSPVGAVRLEFGYGASEDDPKWRLHLNIGAEF